LLAELLGELFFSSVFLPLAVLIEENKAEGEEKYEVTSGIPV